MACQTISDLEAALGKRALAEQVVGNVNTVLQLRAQSILDADRFSALAGTCRLTAVREGTSVRPAFFETGHRSVASFDASFQRSLVEEETPLVPAQAVMELGVGEFFGKWDGKIYRGRFPLLDRDQDTQ